MSASKKTKTVTKPSAKRQVSGTTKKAGPKPQTTLASNNELDRIKRLIRAKGESLLRLPNVTSVGVGYKVTGKVRTQQLAIQFSVSRKATPEVLAIGGVNELPKAIEFEGVAIPTDIVERSFQPAYSVVALKQKTNRKSRVDPIRPGVSVGHLSSSAGTLGAIAIDRSSRAPVMLSNWHVLCGAKGKIGDTIVQPGPFDDDRKDRNAAGKLLRSHLGFAGDCAIASIEGRKLDTMIVDLGVQVASIGKPELGDLMVKSGRTTDVTYGLVSRVDALFKMPYDGIPEQTIGGFEVEPSPKHSVAGNEISKGGDSGSAWMAVDSRGKTTSTMLGLHFGGDAEGSEGEFALACYAHSVFEKLELDTFGPSSTPEKLRALSADAVSALRSGFDVDFLSFTVPRPKFIKAVAHDLVGLDGSDWIDYCHFTVWLSKSLRLPRCVAWNIDGARKKSLNRKGISFVKDDRDGLDEFQFGDELYEGNDLDRGHIARRDDLVWGTPAEAKQGNIDSFFFTNMTPQHKAFNQSKLKGQWGLLENAILDEVELKDLRVSVMGGPIFSTIDRIYRSAHLPAEYWKTVFFVDDADGAAKARAFILTQRDLLKTLQTEALELEDFHWYQVPISTIERQTGIRFENSLRAIDAKFPQVLGVLAARLIEKGNFFL